jgi:membrane protease YdiL (CAAX protease family)
VANISNKEKRIKTIVSVLMSILAVVLLLLEMIPIEYVKDTAQNAWIGQILRNLCGIGISIGFIYLLQIKPFYRPMQPLCLLPCLLIALNNFPLISFLLGNMRVVRTECIDIVLFLGYCLTVGIFEELIFRGVLFATLTGCFSRDKKGLFKAFLVSSVLFGASHLLNVFYGAGLAATLLQVVYSTLTGGLFCFVFIKTGNVLCSALVHAVYNICGLFFELPTRLGLGTGVVFDVGTTVMMAIIYLIGAIYVLYSLYKYSELKRTALYARINGKEGG